MRWMSHNSLPEFMNFQLFGKTIFVVNKKFGLFLAIHSANERIMVSRRAGFLGVPRRSFRSEPLALDQSFGMC